MAITAEALEAAMNEVDLATVDTENKERAKRFLTDHNLEINDSTLKLYISLYNLKGKTGKTGRVTPKLWGTWKHKLRASTSIERTFWLVPQANMIAEIMELDIDTIRNLKVRDYIVPNTAVQRSPVNLKNFVLVRKAVPEHLLGLGVDSVVCSISNISDQQQDDNDDVPQALADLQQDQPKALQNFPAQQEQQNPSGAMPGSDSPVPLVIADDGNAKETRTLKSSPSDVDDPVIFTKMAESVLQAIEHGRLYVEDPCAPTTAEFKLRSYAGHVSSLAVKNKGGNLDAFAESLPSTARGLPKVVAKALLGAEDGFKNIKQFAKTFGDLAELGVAFPTGRAICKLAAHPLDAETGIDFTDCGLTATQKDFFEQSALYAGYMTARWRARLQRAKADASTDMAEKVRSLQRQCPPGHEGDLKFPVELFINRAAATIVEQVDYVFNEATNFKALDEWCPGHKLPSSKKDALKFLGKAKNGPLHKVIFETNADEKDAIDAASIDDEAGSAPIGGDSNVPNAQGSGAGANVKLEQGKATRAVGANASEPPAKKAKVSWSIGDVCSAPVKGCPSNLYKARVKNVHPTKIQVSYLEGPSGGEVAWLGKLSIQQYVEAPPIDDKTAKMEAALAQVADL
eukprot:TRINITY_DN91873_c0_g1_i1.p1 TRINITY_DN91873_c0_g1~~TRINITY_DN91873_c0_g1_i1.p1  ORF type:complete len:628 (-),score=152.82 TRINITY_DN91873_c0_g1_i1:117-2000(-)